MLLRVLITLFTFAILLSSCITNNKQTKERPLPLIYKTGKHISYPESKFITAFSFDKNQNQADLMAKKELAMKISSTISAKDKTIKRAYLENSKLISNSSDIKHYIKIESSFKHNELIKIVDRYYAGNNKYYSFAVLNKDKYLSLLESEMSVENTAFRKKYKLALEMLDKLNIKEFKKIKKELFNNAIKYDNSLLNYSIILNNSTIYEKQNISQNMIDLNNLYKEKLNQNWYIYSVYNKITKKDFSNLIKKFPNDKPWILRSDDNNRISMKENKELTKVVYETLRNENFRTFELSEFNYNPKKLITRNDLDNLIKAIDNNPKNKVVISLSLIYKCSYDKAFYYCRTGADIKAYNLENKDELFYFSIEGQTSRKTKAVDINFKEAMRKSIKKLSPIIKEKIINYMKDYKDIE